MRISWRWWLRIGLVIAAVILFWLRLVPHSHPRHASGSPIADLSSTSPLNQPGGAPPPADAYEVYSALYQAPLQEPLVIADRSVADIPQVGGSCLKPSNPDEQQMTDAFVAANRQSHRWESKFTIPQSYRLLSAGQTAQAQTCLQSHGQDASACSGFKDLRHIRYLGVPGFDKAHTHALVSVIRNCGGFCGTGGIFVVEKSGATWQRVPATDFTRDCSWMY